MSQSLKVGVVGVGGIARVHMPGWNTFENTEVIAGCDLNEAVLKVWGQENDVDRLYTDFNDFVNDPDIDIVDIITPNAYHMDMTIAALEAGKHVLCEKPLAPTPTEIQKMIEVRDRTGKMLMTAQHQRFRGVSKSLKAEIEAGALGEVYHSRAWVLRRAALPGSPTFILKKQSGGGACIDIGVHILDMTLWLMDFPKAISVTGVARTELAKKEGAFSIWRGMMVPEIEVEEFAAAFIRFDNGATLMLEISWMLHHDTPVEDMQLWLYGQDGGARWPTNEIYQSNYQTQQLYTTQLNYNREDNPPHAQECIEFAQAILDGAPSPVPAEQSLEVAKILDAIYKSQETGAEVRLD